MSIILIIVYVEIPVSGMLGATCEQCFPIIEGEYMCIQ